MERHSRRRFLAVLPLVLLGPGAARLRFRARGLDHPDPRPGITAGRVTPAERLDAATARVFDLVRQIPHIVDGIRCACGCADIPDYYSLLSCFEGDGMGQHCEICKGQARLAHRLHSRGRTLNEIRAAMDAEFG